MKTHHPLAALGLLAAGAAHAGDASVLVAQEHNKAGDRVAHLRVEISGPDVTVKTADGKQKGSVACTASDGERAAAKAFMADVESEGRGVTLQTWWKELEAATRSEDAKGVVKVRMTTDDGSSAISFNECWPSEWKVSEMDGKSNSVEVEPDTLELTGGR